MISTDLRIEKARGSAIAKHLLALAELRVTVFREFPYLYDGDDAYESKYLQTYVNSPDSLAVLVYDGDTIVGATTCIPLEHEVDDLKRPFLNGQWDIKRIFYFGESLARPAYRGRGLGVRFFDERQAHAQSFGRFDTVCFCVVERPLDHPRRPANYRPLDEFWNRRGFQKQDALRTTFSWKDLDEPGESYKPMVYWTKALAP